MYQFCLIRAQNEKRGTAASRKVRTGIRAGAENAVHLFGLQIAHVQIIPNSSFSVSWIINGL
jgi:hypothetical protein